MSNAERIKLNKLVSKVIKTLCDAYTSMSITNIILHSAITFKKESSKKFVTGRVMNTVKDMIGSGFLTGISVRSNHRYMQVAQMILKHEGILATV